MSKKIKTIFEYFGEYSKKEIVEVLNTLNDNDKELLSLRYGKDLEKPNTSLELDIIKRKRFYDTLIPKIRRRLEENRHTQKKIIVLERFLTRMPSIEILGEEERLLELIRERKNNNEICEILNIEPYQLHDMLLRLKNKGKIIRRKYYSDGTIKYKNITTFSETKTGQDRTLITDAKSDSLKLLAISDLHVGNDLERIDLINRAFNYCAKNDIHVILSGGDLIDGNYTQGNQKIIDVQKQLDYFIKNYPYDKNILTFGVAGDHDFSAFCQSSLDIIEVLNNFRQDVIIGGYNNTGINIKYSMLPAIIDLKSIGCFLISAFGASAISASTFSTFSFPFALAYSL